MKKRLCLVAFAMILCIAVCVAGLIRGKVPSAVWTGKSSGQLAQLYQSMKADVINEKDITLYLDKKAVSSSTTGKLVMGYDLDLLMPVSKVNDLFDCGAAVVDAETVKITVPDADAPWKDDDSASFTTPLRDAPESDSGEDSSGDEGGRFVSVNDIAEHLGYSCQWKEDENAAYLVSPESEAGELPSSYDLRDYSKVSPVRDQLGQGSCWSFAAMSALESALLPDESWDFSEDYLINRNGYDYDEQGGDYLMALACMLGWNGPVTEEEDPYGDGYSPDDLTPAVHLQGAVILNNRDMEQIKRLIYSNGAVQASIYYSGDTADSDEYYNADYSSYYYPETTDCNHDVDIIGWDDDFPKEYFNVQPENDGAFICKNSWGSGFGDNGYFYISYEDPNIGIYGAGYTDVESNDNYDAICQSDLLGWTGSIGYESPHAQFSAVYTASGASQAAASGFYATGADTWYDIYIVHDFQSKDDLENGEYLQSGYICYPGFYTIPFEVPQSLDENEKFAIVIDIYTKDSTHPVAMEFAENEMSKNADISDGESYMSSDGSDWVSMEDSKQCNACLKVYLNSRQ